MTDERTKKLIEDSEMVLIGLGEEFRETGDTDTDSRKVEALNTLALLMKGKTYFVLTQNPDELIFRSRLLPFFIAAPFGPEGREESSEDRWKTYMRWLAGTLGHKLCILELGVGFDSPQLIRWPFEKTVQLNIKSTFVRVHSVFPHLTEELTTTGRAFSVKENAVDYLLDPEEKDEAESTGQNKA